MTDRELMQMALDALEEAKENVMDWGSYASEYFKTKHGLAQDILAIENISEALRARLAEPEPEPVATVYDAYDTTGIDWHCKDAPATGTKLYTAPPQREWQGLTDEDYEAMAEKYVTNCYFDTLKYARAIEAKLKEKNT